VTVPILGCDSLCYGTSRIEQIPFTLHENNGEAACPTDQGKGDAARVLTDSLICEAQR
jgi:hypothetical protein